MNLGDFLKMYEGNACITIYQLPYLYEERRYTETYFEEEECEDVINSDIYSELSNKQVCSFGVIGGGCYETELSINLK